MATTKKSSKATSAPVVTETTAAPVVTETTAAAPVVVAAKAPSKTSQAKPIFMAALAVRQAEIDNNTPVESRVYKTNKDFRLGVCNQMASELQVTLPSAGSMYNTFKQEVEAEAAKNGKDLGLGRDPKKERPAKKVKVVVTAQAPLDTTATDTAQATTEPAAAQ